MNPRSFVICVGLWMAGHCGTSQAEQVPAGVVDGQGAAGGRYTLTDTEQGAILLDTLTGQTWLLMPHQGQQAWLPVPRPDAQDPLTALGARVTVTDGVVREIDLTDSAISDGELQWVAAHTGLEQLILNGCSHLTDAGLAHLSGLTNLKGLALERTGISDAGLAHLKGLTRLNYLSLNFTRIGDAGLAHLAPLTNVNVLYLCQTDVGDAGVAALEPLSQLQWLDLRGTRVTDTGVAHLGQFPRLRLLSLHGILMTDAGITTLVTLSNIEALTLSGTRVTDAGLPQLARLSRLSQLDLEGTSATQNGVNALQQALPQCQIRFAEPSPVIEFICR